MRFIFQSANASEPHHGPESTFTKSVFERLKRILLLPPCTHLKRRSQIPPASSSISAKNNPKVPGCHFSDGPPSS